MACPPGTSFVIIFSVASRRFLLLSRSLFRVASFGTNVRAVADLLPIFFFPLSKRKREDLEVGQKTIHPVVEFASIILRFHFLNRISRHSAASRISQSDRLGRDCALCAPGGEAGTLPLQG